MDASNVAENHHTATENDTLLRSEIREHRKGTVKGHRPLIAEVQSAGTPAEADAHRLSLRLAGLPVKRLRRSFDEAPIAQLQVSDDLLGYHLPVNAIAVDLQIAPSRCLKTLMHILCSLSPTWGSLPRTSPVIYKKPDGNKEVPRRGSSLTSVERGRRQKPDD